MARRRELLAWVAGVFEGEGCWSLHHRKDRPNPARCACITMCDKDILLRVQEVVGGRGPYGPYQRPNGNKDQWTLRWNGPKAVELAKLLRPWMGERRTEALDRMTDGA